MAENPRWNVSSLSSDPVACTNELTRTNSNSSELTTESSIDHVEDARQGQSMVWTDEKHNLYLDLLEATFVQQLHSSMSLHGWHSQEEMQGLSTQSVAREHNSSDQFMVLQDGCRQKINYESNEPLLDSNAESNDILERPSVHHPASVGKHYSATSSQPREKTKLVYGKGLYSRSNMDFRMSARNFKQHPEYYSLKESWDGCAAEASGQNFVDEGEKTDSISWAKPKRPSKAAMVDSSSSDHVVPLRKFHLVDNSTIIETETSSNGGKRKLLSKQPKRFSGSKSGMHYFLRGS